MQDSSTGPGDTGGRRWVAADVLTDRITQLLTKKTMFGAEAKMAAQRLVEADLGGFAGDGVRRVPALLEAIDLAHIDPRAQLVVERETAAMCVLDAGKGMGQVAATKAVQRAIKKAADVGTGTVVVRRSQWMGPPTLYAALAAREGLIALCTTNSGSARVVGDGGQVALNTVTTIAWGFPRAEGPALLIDQPSARGTWEDVERAQQAGQTLPECVALDCDGQSTTRPDEAQSLFPWAGPAGVAAGLVASVLSGVLAGGRLPVHKQRAAERDGAEHFFYVIDPRQFGDADAMQAELEAGMDVWRDAHSDTEPWRLATESLDGQVALSQTDFDALAQLAGRLQVDWPE